MRVLAILQARLSSSRLPGKVLAPILGKPMLQWQIERINQSRSIDELVVATSDQSQDDLLADLINNIGARCCRGPLDDVLSRFGRAISEHDGDLIVRLTGDCPLTDPDVIDTVVAKAIESGANYVSNTLHPTYPDGLDVEVIKRETLQEAVKEAIAPHEREHVTPFIYRRPERYSCLNVENFSDLSKLRWTVDTAEDLEFVRKVYAGLQNDGPSFRMRDILDFLEMHPAVAEVNNFYRRNFGCDDEHE